jgi:hypothetical protein
MPPIMGNRIGPILLVDEEKQGTVFQAKLANARKDA